MLSLVGDECRYDVYSGVIGLLFLAIMDVG